MSNTAQNNFQDSKIKKIWKFFNSPFPSIENQGDGFQYGLGVSRGDCFKILSSSL